ncbi:DNA primase family protein [Streptomyces sviceus]|uniref:DNA primase family protein n=1 Tax=Streptomyces sviceus TaxID=285530 RepID=UPI0036E45AD8
MTTYDGRPVPTTGPPPENFNVQQSMVAGEAGTSLDVDALAQTYLWSEDWAKTNIVKAVTGKGQLEEFNVALKAAKKLPANRYADREVVPGPHVPMPCARHILGSGLPILRCWRESWLRWDVTHWVEMSDSEVRALLYVFLEDKVFEVTPKPKKGEEAVTVRMAWNPDSRSISTLMDALRAIVMLPDAIEPPVWLGDGVHHEGIYVSMANGILDLKTRTVTDHDPEFFNVCSIPFAYDAQAKCPRWTGFVNSVWSDDPQARQMLQEFFGFIISGRKHPQKIVILWGPTRSGKGVTSRVLKALVGSSNVVAPTMRQLGETFGLESLIGKPLAIIGDARPPGQDSAAIVERLLTISGGDALDVGRKYKRAWTGELPTRFLILSNEPPTLHDASGVIADRYVLLRTMESYLNREDAQLEPDIHKELPGILNWALDGFDRLTLTHSFTPVESGAALTESIRDAASPIGEFVRERCVVGDDHWVVKAQLYEIYKGWCDLNGHKHPVTSARFTTLLHSVIPGMTSYRPHGQSPRYGGVAMN